MCELTRTADSDKPYYETLAIAPGGYRLWTDPAFGCVQHDLRAEGEILPQAVEISLR